MSRGMERSWSSSCRSESKPPSSPNQCLNCACGIRAPIRTSNTSDNPGRRFLGCGNYKKEGGCSFFAWYDPPTCSRGLEYGNHLLGKVKAAENEIADLKRRNEEILTKVGEIISSSERLSNRAERLSKKNEEMRALVRASQANEIKLQLIVVFLVVIGMGLWFNVFIM